MPSDLIHVCVHVETASFPTAPRKASSTAVVVCVFGLIFTAEKGCIRLLDYEQYHERKTAAMRKSGTLGPKQ